MLCTCWTVVHIHFYFIFPTVEDQTQEWMVLNLMVFSAVSDFSNSVSKPNSEEVPLKEFRIPSKESCMQSETEALIEQDLDPPSPAAHSGTKRCSLLTDFLDPSTAFNRGTLTRSCSRDSVRSLRRASSLDDIDGMRTDWNGRQGDTRNNSSECLPLRLSSHLY